MPRVILQDVKDSLGIENPTDILNAIHNSGSDLYQQYVPLASVDNIPAVGAGIMINQTVQNEFITSLVNRIALVVIRTKSMKNQLSKFKKGKIPNGYTIEEIYSDIVKANKYDPDEAEDTAFKRSLPNVSTLFHQRNRQDYYPQTIEDAALRAAFTSLDRFTSFFTALINSVYNSAEVDEYKYMKLIVDNYAADNLFTVVSVTDPVDETSTKEFVKKVRSTARKMTLPVGSRDYNALAVHTVTDMDNLHLLIDADLESELDVDVLAVAFNMNKADFMGHVTVIDNFATPNLQAVLVDYDWFMVYDNLQSMETIRNPKGLYWNYYYHVWQTLSASRFSNAVAFMSGTPNPITNIIVNPEIASRKAGKTLQYTAYVRVTDGGDYPVTWAVAGSTSSTTVASGTSIDSNGLLTIGSSQTGELKVTATATYTDPSDGTTQVDVVGEALVSVIAQ